MIEGYHPNRAYKVVNRCPTQHYNMTETMKCSNTNHTIIGKIPVTNIRTNVTFQNVYCALCHGQYLLITRWQMRRICNIAMPVENTNMSIEKNLCKIKLLKPSKARLKSCFTPSPRKRQKRSADPKRDKKPHEPFGSGFRFLFNFGIDGSTNMLLTSDDEKTLKNICKANEILNPFTRECLRTDCPTNYITVDGECVAHNTARTRKTITCIDIGILYKKNNRVIAPSEKEIKKALVTMLTTHYRIEPQDVIIPSALFANRSQCQDENVIQSSGIYHLNKSYYPQRATVSPILQTPNGPNLDEKSTCTDYRRFNESTAHIVLSIRFVGLNFKIEKLSDLVREGMNKSDDYPSMFELVVYTKSGNYSAAEICITDIDKHVIRNDWCDGIKNEYFNDQFQLLSSSPNPKADSVNPEDITGIKCLLTNRTYARPHFQYTAEADIDNGFFWENISQIASTCDVWPRIQLDANTSCLKLRLDYQEYQLLPNRSIMVASFENFSQTKMPFESSTNQYVQSVFNLDEYEYIWTGNDSDNSSNDAFPNTSDFHALDKPVSVCMPSGLIILILQMQLWDKVNIKPSCSYLKDFGWGSTIAGVVCSLVSMIAMVLVLITYFLFRTLRTLPGVSLMNLTTAVMLSQITFLVGLFVPALIRDESNGCFIMAAITHYCALASFMWMNVMAYSSYQAFGANLKTRLIQLNRKNLVFNSLYGWGLPALIVTICIIIDIIQKNSADRLIGYGVVTAVKLYNTPNPASDQVDNIQIRYRTMATCWIGNSRAAVIIFGLPLIYSVIVNLALFIKTCIGKTVIILLQLFYLLSVVLGRKTWYQN